MAVNLESTTYVKSRFWLEIWRHTLRVCHKNAEMRDRATNAMPHLKVTKCILQDWVPA